MGHSVITIEIFFTESSFLLNLYRFSESLSQLSFTPINDIFNTMLSNQIKNQHLLCRAAFGPMTENANQLQQVSQHDLWKLLVKTSSDTPEYLDVSSGAVDGFFKGIGDAVKLENMSREERKEKRRELRKQSIYDLRNLNLTWLSEMINSKAQLREKMSFFWHGHFACRVINVYYQQQLLDVIRRHALGNFGDLLKAVSKSAAMLAFLNNQQNKKEHPNENFAREVMELFTMGRGNYTEQDIKESARAYTGWGFKLNGEFVNRKYFHDNGTKTFLGRTGNFNGDDALNIILEQKATAVFITKKLYAWLVNEAVDMERVQALAEGFYQSNYSIMYLLDSLFSADWFYENKNVGNRIKSPVELIAGIRRMIPMELDQPEIQLLFQKVLGQVLFYPPNVAGWPGGKSWIDSSSLILRLKLPSLITSPDEFSLTPKSDDDVMMGVGERKNTYRLQTNVNWETVDKVFQSTSRADLTGTIGKLLLQSESGIPGTILGRYTDASSRTDFIQSTMLSIMSTPEYQLC